MIITNTDTAYTGYIDKITNSKESLYGCVTYALYNLEVYLGIARPATERCKEISKAVNEYLLNEEKVAAISDYHIFLFETYSSKYKTTLTEKCDIYKQLSEVIANESFKLILFSDNNSEIAHLSSFYCSNNKLYIDGAETSIDRLLLTLTRENIEIITVSKKSPI